ncbi:hypothetical protein N7491_008988 [Penicillium cf. griseofulvum]|uniref:Uncharacterized protein n=1 Tax=Penicillium cf. griseofulvum TaxID=2972120 RepID=A0A9W9MG09_9EURO|nr:hypothetical protein N7472_005416 [Penicillium cf. griseofulvum]KAJ5423772.1 hypothetical protein N7491_008988 [Penicillium cf. griseofulvum]KAJ5430975.1 hypothetical protein N7445_008707 [Penicillium cf. griseofulvum]
MRKDPSKHFYLTNSQRSGENSLPTQSLAKQTQESIAAPNSSTYSTGRDTATACRQASPTETSNYGGNHRIGTGSWYLAPTETNKGGTI